MAGYKKPIELVRHDLYPLLSMDGQKERLCANVSDQLGQHTLIAEFDHGERACALLDADTLSKWF